MPSDESPKICTTSGKPIDEHTREINPVTGQQKDYIILCPEERAKGFVRPYRDRYIHRGRSVCGKYVNMENNKMLGGMIDVCIMEPGHEDECLAYKQFPQPQAADIQRKQLMEQCGTETRMGQALSETYARDPSFYGATFCCACREHFPVNEFVWAQDGQQVGS